MNWPQCPVLRDGVRCQRRSRAGVDIPEGDLELCQYWKDEIKRDARAAYHRCPREESVQVAPRDGVPCDACYNMRWRHAQLTPAQLAELQGRREREKAARAREAEQRRQRESDAAARAQQAEAQRIPPPRFPLPRTQSPPIALPPIQQPPPIHTFGIPVPERRQNEEQTLALSSLPWLAPRPRQTPHQAPPLAPPQAPAQAPPRPFRPPPSLPVPPQHGSLHVWVPSSEPVSEVSDGVWRRSYDAFTAQDTRDLPESDEDEKTRRRIWRK